MAELSALAVSSLLHLCEYMERIEGKIDLPLNLASSNILLYEIEHIAMHFFSI